MVDPHSHFLPGIDDGSPDPATSLAMLSEAKRQGVTLCVATPHFYAARHRIADFLSRREAALEALLFAVTDPAALPEIGLGAEVAFFPGIARAEGVESLCIRGTDLLLLEMPFTPWTRDTLEEVRTLNRRVRVVLAHLERFAACRPNRPLIRELQREPLEVQVNAESLGRGLFGSRVPRLIREDFLPGSDMHGLTRRPPNLDRVACLSAVQLSRIEEKEKSLFAEVEICPKRPR